MRARFGHSHEYETLKSSGFYRHRGPLCFIIHNPFLSGNHHSNTALWVARSSVYVCVLSLILPNDSLELLEAIMCKKPNLGPEIQLGTLSSPVSVFVAIPPYVVMSYLKHSSSPQTHFRMSIDRCLWSDVHPASFFFIGPDIFAHNIETTQFSAC